MQKKQLNPRLIILSLVAFVAFVSLIAFFIHFATHGRLAIISDYPIKESSFYSHKEGSSYTSTDLNIYGNIPAGDYLVELRFEDNQLYSEEITIDGFFATTTITIPTLSSVPYIKTLNSTLGSFLPLSTDSYLSFYPYLSAQVISGDSIDSFVPLSVHDAYFTSNSTLVSLSVSSGTDGNSNVSFYYYDSKTNKNNLIATHSLPGTAAINHGQDGFYLINNRILYSYAPNNTSATTLPDNIRYSMASDSPIASKNSTHIALLDGNDYLLLGSEDDTTPITQDLKDTNLHIYPLNSLTDDSTRITIPLDKSANIYAVSISPNSKHIAVFYDSIIQYYDTSTRKIVLTTWATTSPDDLLWISDDRVVFQSDFKIQQTDLTKKSTSTILAPNKFNISTLCGFKNSRLYFTAFEQDNYTQTLPAGYYIDLPN